MAKQKKATRKDRAKFVHIIQRHLRRKERQDEACSHLKNSETKYITRTSKEGNKRLDESKQHSERAFIGKRSGAHGLGAPTEEI